MDLTFFCIIERNASFTRRLMLVYSKRYMLNNGISNIPNNTKAVENRKGFSIDISAFGFSSKP